MNIPMKYEDVVAKLEAERLRADVAVADCNDAERREAALHEEFDAYKIKRTEFAHKVGELTEKLEKIIDALQQRLTVAEQTLGGMLFAFDDGVGREWSAPLLDFARTITPAVEFVVALKPAAEGEGS